MIVQPRSPVRIVAFSGNTHRPSKSRALAELIGRRIQSHIDATLTQYDIVDVTPGLGAALTRAQLSRDVLTVLEAVESSDILVVATPVYKGSYTGLFKHFFDFVDVSSLVGKPVVISATGGGSRHALVVEHQLRPLFGFFSALTIPTSVYAEDKSFEGTDQVDAGILARIELAATQTATLVGAQRGGQLPKPIDTPEDPESGSDSLPN